ncbi:MAG: hypothetical protein KDA51_12160, partial [Planctomycetales bacterium]|nr:hypothetical protein [Planctomycetales bacterium]
NVFAFLDAGDRLSVAGDVRLNTAHGGSVVSTVAGDVLAEQAAIGGSFAMNDVDVDSHALILRSLSAEGDIAANATTSGNVLAEARASAKGTGDTDRTSDDASNAELAAAGSDKEAPSADAKGKVTAGAATALNLVSIYATSNIGDRTQVTSSGSIALSAANSVDSSVKADASAVGSGTTEDGNTTGGTDRGLGIAVAINSADVAADASVGVLATVESRSGLKLSVTTETGSEDAVHQFSAEAISGAGGRKTGFAGSFALNKVHNRSQANVSASASIDVGEGPLELTSSNTATNTAKATPSVNATGETRGVGISFALNIAENETQSRLDESATIAGNNEADQDTRHKLVAESNQTATTEAKGGSGSETQPGEKALTPVFAIQAVRNVTEASTAPASSINLQGSLTLDSQATIRSNITAEGTATAENAARGLVLALDLGDNQTHASLGGDVITVGGISVNANADTAQQVDAKASAKGGDINPTEGGTDKDVADAKAVANRAGAKDNGQQAKKLKTPNGPVSFAAALAIGLSRSETSASIGDGSSVSTIDALTVTASGKSSSAVKADATALTVQAAQGEETPANSDDASGRGIGVAIAMNISSVSTLAEVGEGAQLQSRGLTVSAKTPAEESSDFSVEAVSGAGGGKVGAAGAFALDVIHNDVIARMDAALVDAGNTPIVVSANGKATSSNKATPSAVGEKRGIGASFALNITNNTTLAEIGDNALIRRSGTLSDGGATNVRVTAQSDNSTSTETKGGAGAEDEAGEKAVTPLFAITSARNQTTAHFSGDDSATSHVSGDVLVQATHVGNTSTKSEGSAVAKDTAVGLAFGFGFSNDEVIAEVDQNLLVDGDISILASNAATSVTDAKASSRGGKLDAAAGDADKNVADAKKEVRDADGQVIDDDDPLAKSPDGSMSVAGALAVNIGKATTVARQKTGSDLTAGGSLNIQALVQANANAKADASAVTIPPDEVPTTLPDPSQTGVGVAIGINAARITTQAGIEGNSETSAASISIDAGTDADSSQDNSFASEAISGAGVDKVGFAGALTINLVRNNVLANVGTGANLEFTNADTSNKNLSVTSRNAAKNEATATSSITNSPTKGIGPAIAANIADNSSVATVDDQVTFGSSVNDLTVTADGKYDMSTQAIGGATAQ